MGNQKTQKLLSHYIVSSFLNSLVLANYENNYVMARLLFDSFHKQFCEKTVWFPLKFPPTSQNTTNLCFMSLLSMLYLKLGQAWTKSSLGSTDWNVIKLESGTPHEFILWQNVGLDEAYAEFRCISHKTWTQWVWPALRTGQMQIYEIWFRVSLLSLDPSASLAANV